MEKTEMFRKALDLLTSRAHRATTETATAASSAVAEGSQGNVVSLPRAYARDGREPRRGDHDIAIQPAPGIARAGIMSTPELESFFAENHFGLGRHNGAHYRNAEALALGKQGVT